MNSSVSLASMGPGQQSVVSRQRHYKASLQSYWSQQEQEVAPSCIVTPHNTQDVATAVRELSVIPALGKLRCRFAIRGGGHTPWADSANIENGITIDLSAIKYVSVNPRPSIVSVGPGNRWSDVYLILYPLNLSVAGGRSADIGVAGLTTGGKAPDCLLADGKFTKDSH